MEPSADDAFGQSRISHHPRLRPSDDVIPGDVTGVVGDDDSKAVDVGYRDYSEGALCQAAHQGGGLTLKGEINLGGQMEITHNNYQDNRVTDKSTHHHHHGDIHQHAHKKFVNKGDVIHHHGDVYHTKHVHHTDSEAGYTQVKDQSKMAMDSDADIFVQTPSFREALQHMSSSGILVISGPPGSGKSCISHALLRHYEARGFTPLILHSLKRTACN